MTLPEALAGDLSLRLRRAQAGHRIPSASAAVFRDGEPLWSEAVGLADVVERGETRSRRRPATSCCSSSGIPREASSG